MERSAELTCTGCAHAKDGKCGKLLPECEVPLAEDSAACCFFEPTCVRCGARATVIECEVISVVGWRPRMGPRPSVPTVLPGPERAYCAACAAARNKDGA